MQSEIRLGLSVISVIRINESNMKKTVFVVLSHKVSQRIIV